VAVQQFVGTAGEAAVSSLRDRIAGPFADQRGGFLEHYRHVRTSSRSLVADVDDVTGGDLLRSDSVIARRLRIEDPGRAPVQMTFVTGQLDDAAVRSERAPKDRQPADRFDRTFDGDDDLLAGRLDGSRGDLGDRLAGDGRRVAMEEVPLQELTHDEPHAPRVVHLRRGETTAGSHVRDDRGAVADRVEIVDIERNPERVS